MLAILLVRFTPGEGLRRVERARPVQQQPSGPSAMEIAKIRVSKEVPISTTLSVLIVYCLLYAGGHC